MLTCEQNYVLILLRKSLNADKDLECPEQVSPQAVIDIVQRNGVLLTVFSKMSREMQNRLQVQYLSMISQAANQAYEGKRILTAFDDVGMDCIALKGWELCKLYPKAYMRQMVDLDIFVRNYKYDAVRTVMERLGYRGDAESTWKHDNFTKETVSVEIHKRLTDDSASIQAWEKGIWDRVNATEKRHVFQMSTEDVVVFHFVHLYKDFMNGSLGLRRIVDTWFLTQQENIKWENVQKQLSIFGMSEFLNRMLHLSKATMNETEINEQDEIMVCDAVALAGQFVIA